VRLHVDVPDPVGKTEGAELHPVRAERVGLDDVGSGPHVVLMHVRHDVGLRQVQRVEAPVDEDALPVQHRPHRPVTHQDAFVERFEEGLHVA